MPGHTSSVACCRRSLQTLAGSRLGYLAGTIPTQGIGVRQPIDETDGERCCTPHVGFFPIFRQESRARFPNGPFLPTSRATATSTLLPPCGKSAGVKPASAHQLGSFAQRAPISLDYAVIESQSRSCNIIAPCQNSLFGHLYYLCRHCSGPSRCTRTPLRKPLNHSGNRAAAQASSSPRSCTIP